MPCGILFKETFSSPLEILRGNFPYVDLPLPMTIRVETEVVIASTSRLNHSSWQRRIMITEPYDYVRVGTTIR